MERPSIASITIEGNNEIDDKILLKDMQLKPRQVYTLARLKHDTKRLQDMYRFKGHFAATVTPSLIRRDQNRVDVVFEVDEGSPTKIKKIAFIGNDNFA